MIFFLYQLYEFFFLYCKNILFTNYLTDVQPLNELDKFERIQNEARISKTMTLTICRYFADKQKNS